MKQLVALCALFIFGCTTVVHTTYDPAYTIKPKFEIEQFNPAATPIGRVYRERTEEDPEASGAMLISNGRYALFHRIALARMAQHTIELQTYIYENDITSQLLLHEMKLAADRGVKIRIIVDDFGLDNDHSDITILDEHPNIEVKVFNTFKFRTRLLRYPQFVFDMDRLNYRMHNKLFIVDNAAMIIGGRNVAGNYFDNNPHVNFSDTDVLFIGKLAQDAVRSFNRYWRFHKSISVAAFPFDKKPLEEFDRMVLDEAAKNPEKMQEHSQEVEEFICAFLNREYPVYWGRGELITDSPLKADGYEPVSPITEKLASLLRNSERSVYISAAYFVPGQNGNRQLIELADSGVKIKVLTNSLSSTDAKVVYAGWIRYRKELLRHGVSIYEFRNEGYKVKDRGGSGASLHSKVIIFDDVTWVGSFNLDPRSADINTEVVALFYSEEFARVMQEDIEADMSEDRSWELSLEGDSIFWQTKRKGETVRAGSSPDTSIGTSLLIFLLSFIPEEQL